MLTLAISLMLFTTGDTLLERKTWAKPDLTTSERVFVNEARSKIAAACAGTNDTPCSTSHETLLMEAINGRRINAEVMRRSPVADKVSYTCSSERIGEQLRCYSDLRSLNYEQAMTRAGYKRLGVSFEAYRKISIGMNID